MGGAFKAARLQFGAVGTVADDVVQGIDRCISRKNSDQPYGDDSHGGECAQPEQGGHTGCCHINDAVGGAGERPKEFQLFTGAGEGDREWSSQRFVLWD